MLKKPKKNGFYKLVNQRTGKIKILKHYKNETIHGKFIFYWDNGQIHITGQYDKMKRIGIWRTYDPDGNLILEENHGSLQTSMTNLLEI